MPVGFALRVGEYVKCSIGIAPNRYLAKVATDLKKPDGLTIITAEDAPQKLAHITLRDLPGIGHNMEQRLNRAGLYHIAQVWPLSAGEMRKIWGSVWGERLWFYLRGIELPEEETTRTTLGHSHVLAPELRGPTQAKDVARRLTLKLGSRLRRLEYYASSLHLSVRIENGPRLESGVRFYRAQDSVTLLHALDDLWEGLMHNACNARLKKVSVSVYGLEAAAALQEELINSRQSREYDDEPLKAVDASLV